MRVLWRTRALADVNRIVGYISAENPAAADRVGRELLLAGDSLALFPRRGRPGLLSGTRELVAVSSYVLVYRIAVSDTVTIVRVWHAAQERPGPS